MSSRIRGRRYRNVDPDERYGFTAGPLAADPLEAAMIGPIVEVVSLDGTPLVGTTVTVDGTSVTMGPGAESSPVILEPRTVTGPSQAEG
jgi:hypothetical protein